MILVFGTSGQLATDLADLPDVLCLGRAGADLSDPAACAAAIRAHAPAAVINAAAYTAVDRAEEEEALATVINGDAPTAMARTCAVLGIPLVSVSTDYVFDGSGTTPWTPDAPTAPLNAYGRSKLAGEQGITNSGAVHAILRTSWVVSAHGNNFVKTMLRLGRDHDALTIVADQHGAPTPARDLARACHAAATGLIADPDKSGTYHFAARPDTTWAGFAREIFRLAGIDCDVVDIQTTDFPTPAARPLNSRLDCASFTAAFGVAQPDWQDGLNQILQDLGELK